jgi:transcriptional regulator with XRE-family HTH domain
MSGIRIDAEKLKRLREARVLSRRELAERSGVGLSTYGDLESGYRDRARPETIRALARVLRVKPESLVVGRPKGRR